MDVITYACHNPKYSVSKGCVVQEQFEKELPVNHILHWKKIIVKNNLISQFLKGWI